MTKKNIQEVFTISLIMFFIFYILELIKEGFVSNHFDLNIVLFVCMVSGILLLILSSISNSNVSVDFTSMRHKKRNKNMQDCLFCKIARGEIPCHKVYEDENVLAFLDIKPLSKGHTVIIPKVHSETLLDLPDDLVASLFVAVKKINQHINDRLRPGGFNLGINMKKVAGQAVGHLHVHILPRWQGDGGGSLHSIINNPPQESLEEILEKIKF